MSPRTQSWMLIVTAVAIIAGAGLAAVARGRKTRKVSKRFGKRRRDVVATRSFLIDVHLLDR